MAKTARDIDIKKQLEQATRIFGRAIQARCKELGMTAVDLANTINTKRGTNYSADVINSIRTDGKASKQKCIDVAEELGIDIDVYYTPELIKAMQNSPMNSQPKKAPEEITLDLSIDEEKTNNFSKMTIDELWGIAVEKHTLMVKDIESLYTHNADFVEVMNAMKGKIFKND